MNKQEKMNGHKSDRFMPARNGKNPAGSIAFDDAIPKRGPELFIKRMAAREEKHFTIYGTSIRGLWVHWNGASGKSEPHYHGTCQGCNQGSPKRWKGFLHAYCSEDKQEVFLELTPASADSIMSQLADPSLLRGSVLKVKRSPAANGRLTIIFLSQTVDGLRLPPEKDPRRSILKLWGVPDAQLDDLFQEDDAENDGEIDSGPECL